MLNFSLFGFPIRVEPFFWLTVALIGGLLQVHDLVSIIHLSLFVCAAFLSILIHELGHTFALAYFHLPSSITLTAFGGYASYPAHALNRRQSFIVSLGGPCLQIAFGILSYFLIPLIPSDTLLRVFFPLCCQISLFWAIFNLLPIFPLDGGQMLDAILGPHRKKPLHIVGMSIALLSGIAAILILQAPILSIFMGLFFYQNYQAYQLYAKR